MAHIVLVWLSVQNCDEEHDTVSLTLPVLQQCWPEVVALQCPRVSTCAGLKELKSPPPPRLPPLSPPAVSDLNCDFEGGYCSWTQGGGDQMDWHLHKGLTDTILTGPPTDHTLQTGQPRELEESEDVVVVVSRSLTSRRHHPYGALH